MNVLVALAWPNHIHHGQARAWFRDAREKEWATCPLTESGFVRVSSNSRVLDDAVSPAEALAMLGRIRSITGHRFWTDDVSPTDDDAFAGVVGYRQVTDAHLLALAIRHEGCLATFDRGVRELAGSRFEAHVELIP